MATFAVAMGYLLIVTWLVWFYHYLFYLARGIPFNGVPLKGLVLTLVGVALFIDGVFLLIWAGALTGSQSLVHLSLPTPRRYTSPALR